MLPLPGAQVPSPDRKLRSDKSRGAAKNKNKRVLNLYYFLKGPLSPWASLYEFGGEGAEVLSIAISFVKVITESSLAV